MKKTGNSALVPQERLQLIKNASINSCSWKLHLGRLRRAFLGALIVENSRLVSDLVVHGGGTRAPAGRSESPYLLDL
jgi:hypothetical protein